MLLMDTDGIIRYTNPATTAMTGFMGNELLRQHFSCLYEGADVIKSEYELSLSLQNKKFIVEGWKVKKDASRFWARMTLCALYDEQQTLAGYSCTLLDQTEQLAELIKNREIEERYRLMVEAVQNYAIVMLSPDGYILSWNEGGRRIKGYNSDEIIGKHFSVLYIREDLDAHKPAIELEIASRVGKYEEEGWRIKKDGSVFWAGVVITALYNHHNQLIGYSEVTQDLSERKEHEERLRQSEQRYRLLVEQVIDYGIFMMDEQGKIVSWNDGARKIKGYTAEEIIGKYFSIFYTEEDLLTGKPAFELKTAKAQGKYEEEGWRLRKNGTRFWANIVITAVYNESGILIGFSKVTRDLTERKWAEKKHRDNAMRYRQLAGELQSINRQLSNANEELGQFTSIASHDLQEPIRTIKSFLKIIERKLQQGDSTDLVRYTSKSIEAADRMKALISNLLDYSQLDKADMPITEVDTSALMEEVLQNLNAAIARCNAQVIIYTEIDTLYGNRSQLVQLLQNLISNSLKFRGSQRPKIEISIKKEGKIIKGSVTDNGIGIEQEDLSKVFEIFRRLKTGYEGTGIGLSICKKIVDKHNGNIWVESVPGIKTSFYFTLDPVLNTTMQHEEIYNHYSGE